MNILPTTKRLSARLLATLGILAGCGIAMAAPAATNVAKKGVGNYPGVPQAITCHAPQTGDPPTETTPRIGLPDG